MNYNYAEIIMKDYIIVSSALNLNYSIEWDSDCVNTSVWYVFNRVNNIPLYGFIMNNSSKYIDDLINLHNIK